MPAVRASRDVQGARQETGVVLRTLPSGGVIERRGNRMVGVKRHVVTVVPPGSGSASGSRTNSNACGRAD